MSNALSRFQIVEGNPPHLPHKCATCGSINGTFIDFQLDLEFYGTVYLCLDNCIRQIANELGYRSPAQHKLTLEAVERQRAEIIALTDRNEVLEDGINAIRNLDAGRPRLNDPISMDDKDKRVSPKRVEPTEPEPTKPAPKSGFADLFSNDGFDSIFDSDE